MSEERAAKWAELMQLRGTVESAADRIELLERQILLLLLGLLASTVLLGVLAWRISAE